MKQFNKSRITTISIVIITFIAIYYFSSPYFEIGGKYDCCYDTKDLKENLTEHYSDIMELSNYVNEIIPQNKGLTFGYDDRSDRFYIIVRTVNYRGNLSYFKYDDFAIRDTIPDYYSDKINIDKNEIYLLYEKMKAANCTSVFKPAFLNKPAQIGFRYGGDLCMTYYSYDIFSGPLSKEEKNNYSDKIGRFHYNDSVYLNVGHPF